MYASRCVHTQKGISITINTLASPCAVCCKRYQSFNGFKRRFNGGDVEMIFFHPWKQEYPLHPFMEKHKYREWVELAFVQTAHVITMLTSSATDPRFLKYHDRESTDGGIKAENSVQLVQCRWTVRVPFFFKCIMFKGVKEAQSELQGDAAIFNNLMQWRIDGLLLYKRGHNWPNSYYSQLDYFSYYTWPWDALHTVDRVNCKKEKGIHLKIGSCSFWLFLLLQSIEIFSSQNVQLEFYFSGSPRENQDSKVLRDL